MQGHSSGESTFLCVSESVVQTAGQAHPVAQGIGGKPEGPATGWPAPVCPRLPPSGHTCSSCGGPGLPNACGPQAASWIPRFLGHTLKFNCTEFQASLGRQIGPTPPFRMVPGGAAVCPELRQGLNTQVLPLGGLCLAPEAQAAATPHLHHNC